MRYFLAKADPTEYSLSDLERDGQTSWNGVLIYHSQGESAIVGLAEVLGNSRPDPNDDRSWLVDFKFIRRFQPPFVTLKLIKDTGIFGDFRLVYQSRLSTMDVPDHFIKWLKERGLDLH